jgi:hypothetical protein
VIRVIRVTWPITLRGRLFRVEEIRRVVHRTRDADATRRGAG